MRSSVFRTALVALSCISSVVSQSATATNTTRTPEPTQISPAQATAIISKTRTVNILADIKGIYTLPQIDPVIRNGTLAIKDIQCDILVGMRKNRELFVFFTINDIAKFKKILNTLVVPRITPVQAIIGPVSGQPIVALNVAFSQPGVTKLAPAGQTDVKDSLFAQGQRAGATGLKDNLNKWIQEFLNARLNPTMDGVWLVASDTQSNIDAMLTVLQNDFGTSMSILYKLQGNIRPPPWAGHEMFGFLDGVSQPAVAGFDLSPLPGQLVVSPGIILTGEPGDTLAASRPAWTKDGSFLAFRQLKQLVPEWDWFLLKNAPPVAGKTLAQAAELLGARMMGRWQSGTPIDLAPLNDVPSIGADPFQNNNFDFSHPGFPLNSDQTHCPFAAHIRKSRPRADQPNPINVIMRAGIPYGPEVTAAEAQGGSSTNVALERGLAFVAYQSQLSKGFQFMQTQWINSINFAPGKTPPQPGFDPIVGQNSGAARFMNGADISNPAANLALPFDFVESRGGEYFFSPSISSIKNILSV